MFNTVSIGISGINGETPGLEIYTDNNGTTGTKGYRGGDNLGGFGGNGGSGGNGGNGEGTSPSLAVNVANNILAVAAAAADIIGASQPFTSSEIPAKVLGAANAVISLGDAVAAQDRFYKSVSIGQIGLGGTGGTGGRY